MGKDDKIYFWTDLWVGENTLAYTFPELFSCATNQESKVIECMERKGDQISRGPTLRRNLKEVESSQFCSMLAILGSVFIPKEGKDRRIWTASSDGLFSMSFFFFLMSEVVVESHSFWGSLGITKAPPRLIVFGWTALLGGILTMDNLRRRKVIVVNACSMCLANEESIDHLLLNCPLAQCIWIPILS